MAKGFKAKPRKQSSAQKSRPHKGFSSTCESEARIRSEIEAFLAKDVMEAPEHYILAWQAGVYNPVAGLESTARFLEASEEDWLFLAKEVGWLQVEEDELDAIYFTAPPPNFDPDQADWYLRPDLTTWLDEPELLSKVAIERPVPSSLVLQAIKRYVQELGWDKNQIQAFVEEVTTTPLAEMSSSDLTIVLLELRQFRPNASFQIQ